MTEWGDTSYHILEDVPFFPEKWLFHLRSLFPSSPVAHFPREKNWGWSFIPWGLSPLDHQEMLSVFRKPLAREKKTPDPERPLFSDGYVFLMPFTGIDPDDLSKTIVCHYRSSVCYEHRTRCLFIPLSLYDLAKQAGCWDEGALPGHSLPRIVLSPSISRERYRENVLKVLSGIREGRFYQVNLAIDFCGEDPGLDPVVLNDLLLKANPSPGSAVYIGQSRWIVSNSPERLFCLSEGTITTSPIAGTLPLREEKPQNESAHGNRSGEEIFRGDPKEHAEHVMTVDLLRNDLGQICRPSSIHLPRFLGVERYRHLWHLVSDVKGDLIPGLGLGEILGAMMPGGSVTGAPKRAVTKEIMELEGSPREYYCGSLGLFDPERGLADFNLLIRTVFQENGRIRIPVGSGLVADSDPEREYEEILAKLRVISDVLEGATPQ